MHSDEQKLHWSSTGGAPSLVGDKDVSNQMTAKEMQNE